MDKNYIIGGILLFILIVTGFWLLRNGKPYGALLFNAHKFIALGLIVLTVIIVVKQIKGGGSDTLELVLVCILGISFIASIISGGILSAQESLNKLMQLAHRISSISIVMSGGYLFYSFLKQQ